MTRTKKRNVKRRRNKKKSKKRSSFPSIKNGLTLETQAINSSQFLTYALSDPYSNPAYQTFTCVARISDCTGLAQVLLQQYEWYRIAGIEMTITNKNSRKVTTVPFNTAGLTANTGLYQTQMNTEFLIIPNRDGTSYPVGITKSNWENAKEHKSSIWIRTIKGDSKRVFRCKPNTLTMGYEGLANTGYYEKFNAWTRNNDFGTPYYSWTVMTKQQSTIREHYEFSFKYILQYKSKQGKDYQSVLEFGQRLTHPLGSVIDGHTAADTNGTGIHTEKTADALVLTYPDHDPETDGPTMNGYDDLDITQAA